MASIVENLKRFNVPPVTKVILGLTIALSVLLCYVKQQGVNAVASQGFHVTFDQLTLPVFELVPNNVLEHPWVLVSTSFTESSLTGIIFAMLNIFVGMRYFEKLWGSKEFLKFLLIVVILGNLLVCVCKIVVNSGTNKNTGGCFSTIFAFIVAFKQIVPEHNIKLFGGVLHVRVKHLPFISLSILTVYSLIRQRTYPALNSFFALLISWCYLRFYQNTLLEPLIPTAENGNSTMEKIKGDASETFAFAYFFPDVLHKFLNPIFNFIYTLMVSTKLVPLFNEEDVIQSNERAARRTSKTSSGSSGIAERRRQIALKVLEERINNE